MSFHKEPGLYYDKVDHTLIEIKTSGVTIGQFGYVRHVLPKCIHNRRLGQELSYGENTIDDLVSINYKLHRIFYLD